MNIPVIRRWVFALRSGKYSQGQGRLNRDGRYCCLGVLTDLAVQTGLGNWDGTSFVINKFVQSPLYLSDAVINWAGLADKKGLEFADKCEGLVSLNDTHNKTFSEIADIIETKIEDQMITLNQAISNVVSDFLAQGKSFSAHDVTTEIRNRVNNFTIDVIDAPPSTEGYPRHISHDTVRAALVADHSTLGLTRQWAGNHWEYAGVNQNSTVNAVPVTSTAATPATNSRVDSRAINYVKSKLAANNPVTLKQVQSTLKRDGHVTCAYLADLLKKAGFNINDVGCSNQHSKYVVS